MALFLPSFLRTSGRKYLASTSKLHEEGRVPGCSVVEG
jgi:hypothetical protein